MFFLGNVFANEIHTTNKGNVDFSNSNIIQSHTSLSQHGVDISKKTYLEFMVKACEDASVSLVGPPSHKPLRYYVLDIGFTYNTAIALYNENGEIVVSTTNVKPLDCHAYRAFWISWSNGIISWERVCK